jgi:hypothetical protein
MKNIHILPTDKPSRLHLAYNKDYYLSIEPFVQLDTKNYKSFNIYITSDSEIKEGDWHLNIVTNKISKYNIGLLNPNRSNYKKIILTTDGYLINDGIQAIDDIFLKWFVKNPTCEHVETNLIPVNYFGSETTVNSYGFNKFIYKIIMPQEEDEQEVAERLFNNFQKENPIIPKKDIRPFKLGFIKGAKWQSERMYSEEDLKEAYFSAISSTGEGWNAEYANGNNPNIEEKFSKGFAQWFEQFKKK